MNTEIIETVASLSKSLTPQQKEWVCDIARNGEIDAFFAVALVDFDPRWTPEQRARIEQIARELEAGSCSA